MSTNALTFLQSVSGYNQAQQVIPRARLATIDSTYDADTFLTGTLPKVTFDGETTLSGKTYPVMSPYWPHANDRVLLQPFTVGRTFKYVIIGTIESDASIISPGRIPGERIATAIETSDSSTFTTNETVIITVEAALVINRIYRIRAVYRISSTVDNDDNLSRIREGIFGNSLTLDTQELDADNQSVSGQLMPPLEVEYTAVATGNKTFVLTSDRQSGTGSLKLRAGTDRPSYLYVDYIRG